MEEEDDGKEEEEEEEEEWVMKGKQEAPLGVVYLVNGTNSQWI